MIQIKFQKTKENLKIFEINFIKILKIINKKLL